MGSDDAANVGAVISKPVRPSSRRGQLLAGIAAQILAALVVFAVAVVAWDYLQPGGPEWLVAQLKTRPYFMSSALLAVEEAGVPLPLPGDVVIMFAADRAARTIGELVGVWLLLMAATLAGAGGLFVVARRFGRRLAEGRVGEALHLNPERIKKAEAWFARRGLWVVLLGRYIPAGRVPITIAAATFGLSIQRFLLAVAASAALWIVVFMVVGVVLGPRVDGLMRAHRTSSLIIPAIVGIAFFGYLGLRLIRPRRRNVA